MGLCLENVSQSNTHSRLPKERQWRQSGDHYRSPDQRQESELE